MLAMIVERCRGSMVLSPSLALNILVTKKNRFSEITPTHSANKSATEPAITKLEPCSTLRRQRFSRLVRFDRGGYRDQAAGRLQNEAGSPSGIACSPFIQAKTFEAERHHPVAKILLQFMRSLQQCPQDTNINCPNRYCRLCMTPIRQGHRIDRNACCIRHNSVNLNARNDFSTSCGKMPALPAAKP